MQTMFDDQVMGGALGRNGTANVGGVEVSFYSDTVAVVPLSVSGDRLRCEISFHAGDCGQVAGMIARVAARAAPATRDKVASDLRAALASIEAGFEEYPEDGVSGFHAPLAVR